MGIPLIQQIRVGSYILKQKILGRSKYPLVLMLEPLNHYDVPRYFYSRAEEAAMLIQKLNRKNNGKS